MSKQSGVSVGITGIFCLMTTVAHADAPLLPANSKSQICAPGGTACVVMNTGDSRITAFAAQNGKTKGKALWTLKRRISYGELSDDGRTFVVIESGNCLTGRMPAPETRFVTFYEKGKLSSSIRASDIYSLQQLRDLPATASNFQWCSSFGLLGGNRFELNLADGRKLYFPVRRSK
jgi:hypothetical protein